MTKKDYKFLSQYEDRFYTATRSSFCRNLSRTVLEEMNRIYENETGKPHQMNFSCGNCQLDLVKRLGVIFYQEKEKQENKENKEEKEVE